MYVGVGGTGTGIENEQEGGETHADVGTTQTSTTPSLPTDSTEPTAALVSTSTGSSKEAHARVASTSRRCRRSRRSLAAARRLQSAASIRAKVREKSRRGVLVSLDASTGELELSLSHLAIDEASGLLGSAGAMPVPGGGGGEETNTQTDGGDGSDSRPPSRRASHMSMASVESWMEEVRRLQEQGQVSDEVLVSILAGENAVAAAASGGDGIGNPTESGGAGGSGSSTCHERQDSSSSLSITDAAMFSGPGIIGPVAHAEAAQVSANNDGLKYYYKRKREMPQMKPLPPLPDPEPVKAPPARDEEQRREARNVLARAAIKRVLVRAQLAS
mmetsp:Transcript_16224/g.46626  ORF Transcript_16224/g.46626 Transcript_16224/m.46626 type:complete len:331 (+) Transcript_16224:199-1191(+)